jgi:hypothetical protein
MIRLSNHAAGMQRNPHTKYEESNERYTSHLISSIIKEKPIVSNASWIIIIIKAAPKLQKHKHPTHIKKKKAQSLLPIPPPIDPAQQRLQQRLSRNLFSPFSIPCSIHHIPNPINLRESIIKLLQGFPGTRFITNLQELDANLMERGIHIFQPPRGRDDNRFRVIGGFTIRQHQDIQRLNLLRRLLLL